FFRSLPHDCTKLDGQNGKSAGTDTSPRKRLDNQRDGAGGLWRRRAIRTVALASAQDGLLRRLRRQGPGGAVKMDALDAPAAVGADDAGAPEGADYHGEV